MSDDLLCVGCGYNLRTQAVGGVCSECARRVTDSLEPSELRFAEQGWLRRIRQGVTLLLVGFLGYAAQIIFVIIVTALSFSSGTAGFDRGSDWLIVSGILLAVLGVGGALLVTAVELQPKGRPISSRANLSARWLILMSLLIMFLSWVASTVGAMPGPPLSILLGAASSLVTSVAAILVLVCLRRIVVRSRGTGLRRLTTALIWLTAVGELWLGGVQICSAILMPQFQTMTGSGPAPTGIATTPRDGTGAPATTPVTDVGVPNADALSGESVADSSAATAAATTSNVVVYSSTNAGGTGNVGPIATPSPPSTWLILFGFLSCGGGLLMAITFILTIVMLALCRRMLTQAIAAAPSNRDG